MNAASPQTPAPLAGVRILSLALNLPGPAALMRCRQMGAQCVKLEPPAGDPMRTYSAQACQELHQGVTVLAANLKDDAGLALLHEQLAATDILLTSFRPAAMARLGLSWEALQARHPHLSQVAIVGAPGAGADIPGHDLTYQAEQDLVDGLALPSSLFADMGGALMAAEAVLQAAMHRGQGRYYEVALSEAARFLALPRRWGMTAPGGAVGGGHPGYQVFACADGRVAVAALEPHFARALAEAAGMESLEVQALARFFKDKSRAQLDHLADANDLPLHTMPPAAHDATIEP